MSTVTPGRPEPETSADSTTTRPVPITVARGDGIGPEIMDAVLHMLETAGAALEIDQVEIGQAVYERGVNSGIEPTAWDSIRRTKVFLKAPITTPQGKGFKSLNVTVRKTLGLFANVRPCPTYHPFIATAHPGMDMVIIRENEEDTYGGIEHRQTPEVTQCLKLISRPGTERIIRYAFEYAVAHGRSKVSCFTKDNIMKITDGLFHRTFREIAEEFPGIEAVHQIIDIGTARLATQPTAYDVVVLPNLFGDIVSDVAAELAGSVGLAGSANIGEHCAMFEAIHGSAPDIAGRGVANPTGLLHGAIIMLDHIGQSDVATRLDDAWRCTIEDGIHTADVRPAEPVADAVGTEAFTKAIVERMGRSPSKIPAAVHRTAGRNRSGALSPVVPRARPTKGLVGVDVFLDWDEGDRDPNVLGRKVRAISTDTLVLRMISNRGTKVYPDGHPETFCTDHWRCRFVARDEGATVTHADVIALLLRCTEAGLDFVKTEHLCTFDGERGYSLGQGE